MTLEQELATSCMVCQESKTELLKDGKDFEQHTEHEHDLWKYSDYLAYLHSKNMVDQSGFESIIWDSYCKKLVNWIPSKDNYSVKSDSEEEALQKKKAEEEAAAKTDLDARFSAIETKLTAALQSKLAESEARVTAAINGLKDGLETKAIKNVPADPVQQPQTV